ncbi:MAG: hypothetical protein WKG07_24190 [Hymenobacter sp.]
MEQTNNSGSLFGNDGYQTQSNGAGTIGQNKANLVQVGKSNYGDQVQAGNLNLAITVQRTAAGGAVERDYSVQEQTGSQNYGYVLQNSNGNLCSPESGQSPFPALLGAALTPEASTNGNYARTMQGGGAAGGTNGTDNRLEPDHPERPEQPRYCELKTTSGGSAYRSQSGPVAHHILVGAQQAICRARAPARLFGHWLTPCI